MSTKLSALSQDTHSNLTQDQLARIILVMNWFITIIQKCKAVAQRRLKSLPCLGLSEEDLTSMRSLSGPSNNGCLFTPASNHSLSQRPTVSREEDITSMRPVSDSSSMTYLPTPTSDLSCRGIVFAGNLFYDLLIGTYDPVSEII
ncbi:hypothetical protein P175DRAFT_0521011 [Aspergillus ochraceoroseus IBT 24754]|uniref:Uncharacterized protein n=1 Tax=Aspergillus ochraceoroseus IBT 24754 TaxID=1392256 RepID=A0A2T5M9L8_9EURO|nr:uncharacterized protein P175DRAFT_0521011 [Aspergillus ochraceoroseus IBT 24754]PTU25205.1 hypothetical protein P175DRAFT_0521011 [Aspergillus ochraceoroseus IBT 24754]